MRLVLRSRPTSIRQSLPIRSQQRTVPASAITATSAATQRNAANAGSRNANSGSAGTAPDRVSVAQGTKIQAATSGTQMSHMRRSCRCSGTSPTTLRVCRRTRAIITPTPTQYDETVTTSTASGRSCIGRGFQRRFGASPRLGRPEIGKVPFATEPCPLIMPVSGRAPGGSISSGSRRSPPGPPI